MGYVDSCVFLQYPTPEHPTPKDLPEFTVEQRARYKKACDFAKKKREENDTEAQMAKEMDAAKKAIKSQEKKKKKKKKKTKSK